jgi:hypothetical protein|tara:strand:- start:146 stop:517 length:372 start_codon:yes stop_codon:yes gene_type:complete
MSANPTVRRVITRHEATVASVGASTVITVSGVHEKGHIAGIHLTNDTDTVTITPILSSESTCSATNIGKILEFSSAITEPEVPIQPIYYEAHDDSGVYKIYLKPVPLTGVKTISYRIDIWGAA